MVVKMKLALVGLCKFKLSLVDTAVGGQLRNNGVAPDGVDRWYLVDPGADDYQPAAREIVAIGELQIDIQVLVGLNGIVDGCNADLGFTAATALTARPSGNDHRYQYSGYQKG